jgi:DNA-binding NtrC family response regulator
MVMADLLVIDDDGDLGELLTDLLVAQGHTVRLGRDGMEGLALLAARLPDLVLLDVEMPRLTGPEMSYRMIVNDAGQEQLPIILISGIPNLARTAEMVGTPYFLSKPYGLDDVTRVIERALQERRPPSPQLPQPEAGSTP